MPYVNKPLGHNLLLHSKIKVTRKTKNTFHASNQFSPTIIIISMHARMYFSRGHYLILRRVIHSLIIPCANNTRMCSVTLNRIENKTGMDERLGQSRQSYRREL